MLNFLPGSPQHDFVVEKTLYCHIIKNHPFLVLASISSDNFIFTIQKFPLFFDQDFVVQETEF